MDKSPVPASGAAPVVLIVDDSSFSRRNMRLLLEGLGFRVEEAGDGAQALERFYIKRPALVVLDLVMPGLTGGEVLAKMTEMDPTVPVMIATSDVQLQTKAELRQAGAKALINKPVTREILEPTVKTVLGGGHTWS